MKKEDPIGEFKEFTNVIANMEVGDKIDISTVQSTNYRYYNVTIGMYSSEFIKVADNVFESTNNDKFIDEATVISICVKVTLKKCMNTTVRLFKSNAEEPYYSKLFDYKLVTIIINTVLLAGIKRLIGKEV